MFNDTEGNRFALEQTERLAGPDVENHAAAPTNA
jgi:hypothetical protein